MVRFVILLTFGFLVCVEQIGAQEFKEVPVPGNGDVLMSPTSPDMQSSQGFQSNTNSSGENKAELKSKKSSVSKNADEARLNREKNPFMIPNHLYLNIKSKLESQKVTGVVDDNRIDTSLDEKIRWSIRNYSLIAIIWNVKKPKALISDKNNKRHIFYLNERIGNNNGIITAIRNGEVIIKEQLGETVFKINR